MTQAASFRALPDPFYRPLLTTAVRSVLARRSTLLVDCGHYRYVNVAPHDSII